MLDASYQAYKSVEIAGFVGWIRRSRRISSRAQMPDATLDASYQAYNPLKLLVLCATSGILTMTPNRLFRVPTLHHPLQNFRFQLR